MGTTRTLADGDAFVQGRSQATAAKLVTAAAEADLKGSVRTTYDGYIAPLEVVNAAGLGENLVHTESSNPERGEGAPVDQLEASPVQNIDGDVPAGAVEATEKTEVTDAGDAVEDYDNGDNVTAFDPTTATVDQVKEYLDGADDDERARVIAAEQESDKPRKGVLDLAATQEGK